MPQAALSSPQKQPRFLSLYLCPTMVFHQSDKYLWNKARFWQHLAPSGQAHSVLSTGELSPSRQDQDSTKLASQSSRSTQQDYRRLCT